EMARQVINDAFDIHGGKAVMKGPSNMLSSAYEGIPVAITVEGANIMTRSLMIFGQGAIRSHPYVLREMELAQREDAEAALAEFDEVLFSHLAFFYNNAARAFVYGLTRGRFAPAPDQGSPSLFRHYRQVTRLSAAFAFVADAAMFTMQSALKRRETISGRLGDLLSMIYLASMVLKQHEDRNCPEEDRPLVDWCCAYLFERWQEAMHEVLENLPNRVVALLLRLAVFPTGRHFAKPSDRLDARVAELVSRDTAARRRLVEGTYLTPLKNNPLGRLHALLAEAPKMEPLERRLRDAVKAGTLPPLLGAPLIEAAKTAGVVDEDEARRLLDWDRRVMEFIHVDEFEYDALARERM